VAAPPKQFFVPYFGPKTKNNPKIKSEFNAKIEGNLKK